MIRLKHRPNRAKAWRNYSSAMTNARIRRALAKAAKLKQKAIAKSKRNGD